MIRPAITGMGVLAPTGSGHEDYWAATLRGYLGITPISRFAPNPYPVRVAGQLPGFVPGERVPSRLIPQTDVWTQHGLTAADLALADAKLEPASIPEYGFSVVTASSAGGVEFGQREIQQLWHQGPNFVGAYQSIAWFYAATTGQTSIRYGMRGPCDVVVSEGAGALDSLHHARRAMTDGVQAVLCGGTDSALSPYGIVCQLSSGRLSTGSDPAAAYVPFDLDSAGYVPGEGGAMFVVENLEQAYERGAPHVYGLIGGYAATFDPAPGSGRPPALRRAVCAALDDAGILPADVDVVFADGAGVPELDRQEATALAEVFGPHGVPVTVPKTAVGRLYSGGAALDVAAALLAIRDRVIPPAINIRRPDPTLHLDLVRDRPRPAPVRTALVLARGYGGFNSALVLQEAP
uniref:KSbeta n=1 Tax=uncultured bacterium BAC-AB1442/1414/561 TaxID=1562172 RepID=A0A0C4SD23_9BACT|nr:KSbeta [uncultured bacterium BAC-AB1442/1414/561]